MNNDPDEEEQEEMNEEQYHSEDDESKLIRMRRTHPDYSEESRRAGIFLGLDFPYCPGDPGI